MVHGEASALRDQHAYVADDTRAAGLGHEFKRSDRIEAAKELRHQRRRVLTALTRCAVA